MEKFQGTSIYNGIAIGKIQFYSKSQQQVKREKIECVEDEIKRYEVAKAQAICELKELQEKAVKEVGEINAAIFEIHTMMLEDDDYNDSVHNVIEMQGVNAAYAVATTGDNFSQMFAEMDDDYFKARAIDVKDISERVIAVLNGNKDECSVDDVPAIIVADDLAPSETVQMDKKKLQGFVTRLGSANSHTAILARTMNIPALIGIDIKPEWNGKFAAIDGHHGILYIEPEEEIIRALQLKKETDLCELELLQEVKGKENVTKSGQKIELYANIGSIADVANALKNDAGGIGLFRSEFLYLEKETYPTEEEQFQAYKTVAENMAGKKVIIRTLDAGADKKVDYFQMTDEENPAMGYRAIRFCLEHKEVFKTQLRALYRASAYGEIAIMIPMIIAIEEVRAVKEIIETVKKELQEDGIQYGEVEFGIMIETPAAVMVSEELAKEVDFFSIGTNDLTQYTLALDRQNPKLDKFYNAHHPAILSMIKMTIENGHKAGCWVGICGELAADTSLTKTFLDMGVDELSVSPNDVLKVRKTILGT